MTDFPVFFLGRISRLQFCFVMTSPPRLCPAELQESPAITPGATESFITVRGQNEELFTGRNILPWLDGRKANSSGNNGPAGEGRAPAGQKQVGPFKVQRKGEGVSGRPSAATGFWCDLMDEVLEQRPSTAPLS
ncbi:uncharacterized protein AB9X84_026763 isoform 2-T3 [Acanthopagrus schlegelii]